jgi:hypothetical protein
MEQHGRCDCHECTQARYRGSLQGQIDQFQNLSARCIHGVPLFTECLECKKTSYTQRIVPTETLPNAILRG